jgi:hypothetical protein
MTIVPRILAFLAFSVFISTNVKGQPGSQIPRAMPSDLIADVAKKKESEPKITPQQLADYANERLAAVGFNYHIDPCDIESNKTEIKFPLAEYGEVFHVYPFTGVGGKSAQLMAKEPGDAPCGCWLELPLTKASDRYLEVVTNKGVVQIGTENKFLVETVELVDPTLKKMLRKWLVFHGGEPAGISLDGKSVYMDLEIEEILVETAADGTLRFVPSSSPDIITKHVDLKTFPKDPENDYLGFRQFTKGKLKYTIKFSHVCT